jgi:hypothetical protein
VDEAYNAGLDGSHPVTLQAKMLRLELLNVKADLEREFGRLVLHCTACGQWVHWVTGLGVTAGHWAHREPAPHGDPAAWPICGEHVARGSSRNVRTNTVTLTALGSDLDSGSGAGTESSETGTSRAARARAAPCAHRC